MTSSIYLYPALLSRQAILPLATALFSSMALSTGLYALFRPGLGPAKIFGILPPSSTPTAPRSTEDTARSNAYLQIYGIRNVASGLSGLGLLAFWRFSTTCRVDLVARGAVQKCVAILFATGSVVGLVDGLIVRAFARAEGLQREQRETAEGAWMGHVSVFAPVVAVAVGWWW